MSGQDLRVLAAAFEQCQVTVSSRAASIVELGGELARLQSVLGSEDVGGDQCGQLASQVASLSNGLDALGGSGGVGGVATGIARILEKFQQVDHAQAANPHLVVRKLP
ncbi:MAG: hypothetical protein JOZ75_02095 [Candidatus Dormibacteraeota bacterium]|nr:hypothetical protein [Candidatus Dormibacteraeota bacterium]